MFYVSSHLYDYCCGSYCMQQAGGCRKHKFWTARVKSTKNNIQILASRAIDWYVYESNWRGVGGSGGVQVFWTLPPKIYWVTPTKF